MSNHSDVAHNFAHKTGKVKNVGNMFYEEDGDGFYTIYSYGHHFAIATLLPEHKFGKTALFTERSYSNSTSTHKGIVSSSISHYDKIYVAGNTDKYFKWNSESRKQELRTGLSAKSIARSDFEWWEKRARELADKQRRARTRDYSGQIIEIVKNVKKYAELFEVKIYLSGSLRKMVYEDFTHDEILSHYFGEEFQAELEAKAKAQREREKQNLKASIQKFRAGESNRVTHTAKFTYLRLGSATLSEGKAVQAIETSKAIKILEDEFLKAEKLFRCAKLAKDRGQSQTDCFEGERIAGYRIEKITKNGTIKTGCHVIPFSEAERIAQALNWA